MRTIGKREDKRGVKSKRKWQVMDVGQLPSANKEETTKSIMAGKKM